MTDPNSIPEPTNVDEPTSPLEESLRQRRSRVRSIPAIMLAALLIVAALGVALLIVAARDLPKLDSLADYRPKQATLAYGADGEIVARFSVERRTLVPFSRIPKVVIDAILAAEDDAFYEHEGLAYLGIVRCTLKNLVAARTRCGASTITQQTARTFFLGSEQTYTRKLREIILAKRMEEALSKDDILYLYLNQINFGHGAYGIEEASKVYFGKSVSDLELHEAALVAGVVQSPSNLDPWKHPERAQLRRRYVLRRLREIAKIDDDTFRTLDARPLGLSRALADRDVDNNNHFIAHVRKEIAETLGPEILEEGGLEVHTGLDPRMQRAAERAVRSGLRALDKRQGWRGPILHVEGDDATRLFALLRGRHAAFLEHAPRTSTVATTPFVVDLSSVEVARGHGDVEELAKRARVVPLVLEDIYAGIVSEVDDATRRAVVDLGTEVRVELPAASGLAWAKPLGARHGGSQPTKPSDLLSIGDVVFVRPTEGVESRRTGARSESRPNYAGVLEQHPVVEGALIAIDPATREVRALVGGYGRGAGTFNRAIAARRQAGSTFKPFLYAAAFETQKFTPVSWCLDAPRVYRDPWTGRAWKPENFGGEFEGAITLREALTRSKNLCSVELADAIGIPRLIDMAKRLGVRTPLPQTLALSLGAGDVTPLEMVNAYATLAAGGHHAEPIFIRKLVDAGGVVVAEASRKTEAVLHPAVAHQTIDLMRSVVSDGTAREVRSLERPVAGKTGTTNDARDAWFIGFVPDLVVGVWVGFDDNRSLGSRETGGRAAIPIWLDFMRATVDRFLPRDFTPPPGILFALVDPKTGKLAPPGLEGARMETFREGTEPLEVIDRSQGSSEDFGLENSEQ